MASLNVAGAGIPMNDATQTEAKRLSGRVDSLESRITYLDETIETLNLTITAQWKEIDGLKRQVAMLGDRLQEAESSAPGAANERPPHY
jgi:SlyX protein